MGLLTDVQKRKKLSTFLIDHHRKAIFLTYFVGIVWFLSLASENVNNKTYFSENALLPGLVIREFNPGSALYRLLDSLKEEVRRYPFLPFPWIQGQFRQLGLDVYTQNFTLHYPFGSKTVYEGKNIYAILRAPKAASTEALVLSTPYRGYDSIHDYTLPSIALMIELASYFRRYTYWSKDIIFLVTEHEMIGFQSWLSAYHNVHTSDFLSVGSLHGSSGPIQGVINLEISNERFSHIDVKIEGLNGQLPNLDLFNLVVELCAREKVLPTFHDQPAFHSTSLVDAWKRDVMTMLSMMAFQASGLPNGGHGLFHRFAIQAVTLVSKHDGAADSSLVHLGRVLEGILRSLNNLLERFHQSFFFYLLPSTQRYISIGMYMPPFGLIAAPVLIKALYLYVSSKFSVIKVQDLSVKDGVTLWSALDNIITSHVLGIVMYFIPDMIAYVPQLSKFPVEESLYCCLVIMLCIFISSLFLYSRSKHLTKNEYSMQLCVTLLELGGFLYTLSLINISLATALALLYIPISVTLSYKGKLTVLHSIFLLLINPFALSYFVIVIQSYMIDPGAVWYNHFYLGYRGHSKVILFTLEDLYFYNNWNYKIATLMLLPLWFQLWMLEATKCF